MPAEETPFLKEAVFKAVNRNYCRVISRRWIPSEMLPTTLATLLCAAGVGSECTGRRRQCRGPWEGSFPGYIQTENAKGSSCLCI